ncbi:hypothetical protein [Motiliproteus sp. MSK22-1]|uniref:hypothetical protein n=1 Tax=Motiliproteus sp. MSK22-1 TaxID=1897630 RepID=UPI00117C1257|nr:hypothetical protein [Motiliproteus sp. MSK22-1]
MKTRLSLLAATHTMVTGLIGSMLVGSIFAGSALAVDRDGISGYMEPGYLNYNYVPGTEVLPVIRLAGMIAAPGSLVINSLGHLEPGYLNYAYFSTNRPAKTAVSINGESAASGSVSRNLWGFMEPGYLNYSY